MTGKTHRVIGLIAGGSYFLSTAAPTYQPATLIACMISSYIGSLVADIDNAKAEIWHTVPLGRAVGKLSEPIIKHRDISHSTIGLVIYTTLLYIALQNMPYYWNIDTTVVIACSALAYISHLLADSFTVEGIPLLWPWKRMLGLPPKPLDGIRIQTGKWFENLVLFPVFDATLVLVIIGFWDKIKSLIYK
jgi:membrane-bound metal-dependent hydrolase YbcI (DUF457 family)